MLTIKKQAGSPILLLAMVAGLLLSGCKPAGQRDLLKGEQLVNENRFADAASVLKSATEELTHDSLSVQARAWNLLGVAYQGSGEGKLAIESYKNALKLDRGLLMVHYNLGCLYLAQANYSEAIKSLHAYTKENPNDADAFIKLATAHLRAAIPLTGTNKTDQLNGAKADLEWALHLAPTDEAYNTLGMVELQRRGANGDALKDFSEALKKNPNYAPALLNVAIYYHSYLNDHKQALAKYKEYVALKPKPGNAADVEKIVSQLESEINPAIAAVHPTPAPPVQPPAPKPLVVTTAPPVVVTPPVTTSVPPVAVNPPPVVEKATNTIQDTIDANARLLEASRLAEQKRREEALAKANNEAAVAKQIEDARKAREEADRLAKLKEDARLAAEAKALADKKEADRLAKQKADEDARNAELVKIQAEANQKAEAERQAKIQADKAESDRRAKEAMAHQALANEKAIEQSEQQRQALAAANAQKNNTSTVVTPVKTATNPPSATVKVKKPGFFGSIGHFVSDLFADDTNDVQYPTEVAPKDKPKEKVADKPKDQPKKQVTEKVADKPKDKPKKAAKTAQAPTPIKLNVATNAASYPPLIELPVKGPASRYAYRNPAKAEPGNKAEGQRLTNAGIDAERQEHLMEAIGDYQNAIQADPACFDAYFRLGLAAHEASDFQTALNAMENALAIQPDSADARYAFAWTLHRGRFSQDAANELEKILAQKPNETRAHLLLANIYAQQLNQPKQAKEHYLKVLEEDPNNAQAVAIRYWLAANP